MLDPDYVIVGGGTAGCVLAARLSENPSSRVLLFEEGPSDSSPWIHLPVAFYKTSQGSLVERYPWTAGTWHRGEKNPTMVQARVLGGGGSVNAMVYLRGQPSDYDQWESAGAAGWGWKEVLPYYIRCESNDRLAAPLHGTDGPLPVSDQEYTHPMSRLWVQACQQAGLAFNPDFNSGNQAGCGFYQINARNGRRGSTARSYLKVARNRKNLQVLTNARVSRILFEGTRAVGVEVLRGNKNLQVKCAREVIVASGAINSPRLLLLSGIGDGNDLKALGIDCVCHLPGVGQNLQDHIEVSIIHQAKPRMSYDKYKKPWWQAMAGLQYALFRNGPCTANIVEGGAFFKSNLSEGRPDLQCCFMPGAGVEDGIDSVPGGSGTTLNICQTRPQSVGYLKLRSADPFDKPEIVPNYLKEEFDIATMCEGVKVGLEIMNQPVIARHLNGIYAPTSASTPMEIRDFVLEKYHAALHPMGTCKMGDDGMSVVNSTLKVHGVTGLRVCDNSVAPNLVSGNTNGVAVMIAEKASDQIRLG